MMARLFRVTMALLLVTMVAALSPLPAFAQGSATSTISGTVTDSTGGVVPGADVTAKNNATGVLLNAVSGSNGSFTIPAVSTGTYTVTVKLMGFKTAVLNEVTVTNAGPANVKAVLELGGLEETVIVAGAQEIIQTQATSVAQTLSSRQIANLPVPGRAAFDIVSYMPGVTSTDGSIRGSQVNGLPQSAVNITLDGMNIQDNYAKTWDGMFTRVSPRLDAVEEVTVSTAAQGADMAGQGGVQIKFVTRSGTNKYQGSAYYYLRRDWMNTNTWFNLHRNVTTAGVPTNKAVLAQYQPGGRFGGPVRIPGLYDGRDKFFFFVNYEWVSSPGTSTNTRTIMSPLSEQGQFQYSGGTVNLMALAAANGQTARIDPIVAKLLADVRSSTSVGSVAATTDPLTQAFTWQQPTKGTTNYPTVRVDYNVTQKHRISFSYTRNHLISDPDTTNSYTRVYPGFPVHGLQDSVRYTGQVNLRSTLTSNMVNELRLGATGGATAFAPDLAPGMFSGQTVGDMNGYNIQWSNFRSIVNPAPLFATSSREGKTKVVEDTLSWIKGAHAMSMGFGLTMAQIWYYQQQYVPSLALGMTSSGDPADAMFTTANFPGASSTDINNARSLYSVLTGRIYNINRNARIAGDGTTFNILGASNQLGNLPQYGLFFSDSWRWKPNLTINAGLRYDWQLPFYATNNSYSMATMADIFGVTGTGTDLVVGSTVTGLGNLFKPGTLQGTATTFKQLEKGKPAYATDWGNLAPSLGAAWTIGSENGVLHAIFGKHGDSVIRAGYSVSYQRGGMNDFTGIFGSNPGVSIDATRNQTNGNLGTLPVLLTGSDLGAPPIPLTRVFPMAVPTASSDAYAFDPNIKTPHSMSWSVGWQRALSKSTSVEARFIHTASYATWTLGNLSNMNYNELNILDNGFFNEFKVAQANLQANITAGKGNTFAYTGAAGTAPLPILLSYFNGSSASTDTTKYSGSNWTSSSYLTSLYPLNPNPYTIPTSIRGNATMLASGVASGRPVNFWVANPDVRNAYVATNGPDTSYNGIQLVFNRRFAKGLMLQANYTYGKGNQFQFYSFHKPWVETEQNYSNSGGGNATGNVRHVVTANWMYELPFGRGKAVGGNAGPILNRIIGNWSLQGVVRLQSGRMIDFGNVRLVGFTKTELQNMFKIRMTVDPNNAYRTLVFILPQDIIDNSIKAYSITATGYGTAGAPTGRYFAPANGPDCIESIAGWGDCGARSVIITGPKVIRVDMNLVKQLALVKGIALEGQLQVFNVFNRVNFNPVSGVGGSTTTNYEVTSANDQSRTMQMAIRISW
ncbi:MAG: TonB-dependent receptor [Acidobacteria bacterium]|nr:TonB-dependent receptor [Acidobacteriota bacterium]